MESLKKNWITYLGILFFFSAFLYFLKYALEHALLPPIARVGIGLVVGATGLFTGYFYFSKDQKITGQVIAGLALAIIYATFSYASLSSEVLWSANTLFIAMTSLTAIMVWVAFHHRLRIVSFISIVGGLGTPLIIQAYESQVWLLFFFVLALNVASLYLSAVLKWVELRVATFIVTLLIYGAYYWLFDPVHWGEPLFYITIFFLVYIVGLSYASWVNSKSFNGTNLYLFVINAINYVIWSVFVLSEFDFPYAYPTLFAGLVFLIMSFIVYKHNTNKYFPSAIYFLLGIVTIAIAAGDLGIHYSGQGLYYVITTSVWAFIVLSVYGISSIVKNAKGKELSVLAMGGLLIFWLTHAWEVEWIPMFGLKFIPFINPGALVWIIFMISGWIFSKYFLSGVAEHKSYFVLSRITALITHGILGGLLTIQLQNLWDAYSITSIELKIVLSCVWMIYALIILLWGIVSKDGLYKWTASAVILMTSAKVFLIDLQGSSSLQKVIFLVVMGSITLITASVYRRYFKVLPVEETEPSVAAE